jgi:hypothetical protein
MEDKRGLRLQIQSQRYSLHTFAGSQKVTGFFVPSGLCTLHPAGKRFDVSGRMIEIELSR